MGVEEIGIHDNFFELGGHSLHVMQVVSKIRTEFKNELPLKILFESGTIADIAKIIKPYNEDTSIKKIQKVRTKKFVQNVSGSNEDCMLNEIDI